MKNLIKRTITGIIYIGFIIGAIIWGFYGVFILSLIFTGFAIAEFMTMVNGSDAYSKSIITLDVVGGLLMSAFIAFIGINPKLSVIFFCLWILWFLSRMITELYLKNHNSIKNISTSLMSQIYIAFPLSLLTLIDGYSGAILMLMFILIWLNDTGAFIFGSLFGKHRLFPRVSPKKSWEGFFGGLIFTIGTAVGAYYVFPGHYGMFPWWGLLIFGIIVTIMSTWGDLIESLMKRSVGVKDSGNILPGHGGILDRIDSLLIVAPATVLLFLIMALYFY